MARILVVDDDADIRGVVARGLAAYEIVTASDGLEAIAVIKGGDRFDVILSDVMMPNLDGVGFYIELLDFAPDQARRVVLVSAGGVAETLRLATDRPFLEKPFELRQLRELVAGVLLQWGPAR